MPFSFKRFVTKVGATIGRVAAPVLTVAGAVFGGPAGAAAGAAVGAAVGGLLARKPVLAPQPGPGPTRERVPMAMPTERPQIVRAVPSGAAAAADMAAARPGMGFLVLAGLALALIVFSR